MDEDLIRDEAAIALYLYEEDEMVHLEWESEENYRRFIHEVAALILNTNTWFNNINYQFPISRLNSDLSLPNYFDFRYCDTIGLHDPNRRYKFTSVITLRKGVSVSLFPHVQSSLFFMQIG